MHSRFKRTLGTMLIAGTALGLLAMPTFGSAPIDYSATSNPVPHDPTADSGSNVSGQVTLEYVRGTTYLVTITASGLSPNLPHLAHIHGVLRAQNECPGIAVDGDGNGLIDTLEGVPAYGPVLVTFSTSGDTSDAAAFDLEVAAVSDANGGLFYQREIKFKDNIAADLDNLHVVIHGEDLNDNGTYDGALSSLGMGIPLEAELPVACGPIDEDSQAGETGSPSPEGSQAGATGTPAASLPNTAFGTSGAGGTLVTLLFGLVLVGSLGWMAYANAKAARH